MYLIICLSVTAVVIIILAVALWEVRRQTSGEKDRFFEKKIVIYVFSEGTVKSFIYSYT